MKIYKTKWFRKWAAKEGFADAVLHKAARELEAGLADALGGCVYKKRIGLPGRGERAFFMYGYPKNERANISSDELVALRLLAKELLGYSAQGLVKAVNAGELIEVNDNDES